MSFDTVDESVQDAQPIELYAFTTPTATTYVTTAEKDIVYGGNTYTATPGARSNLTSADVADNAEDLNIELFAAHALPQSYANGLPPREVAVVVLRYFAASGFFAQLWSGYVASLSFAGDYATFRVPSGTADALQVQIPSLVCSRLCQHVLYDDFCTVSRAGLTHGTPYAVSTTISSISPDGLTLSLAGSPFITDLTFFQHGEILHTSSTERRTITATVNATDAQIQVPFPGGTLHVGDALTIYAGCDHTVATCFNKFANVVNFGGLPYLPRSNVFYVGLSAAFYGSGY